MSKNTKKPKDLSVEETKEKVETLVKLDLIKVAREKVPNINIGGSFQYFVQYKNEQSTKQTLDHGKYLDTVFKYFAPIFFDGETLASLKWTMLLPCVVVKNDHIYFATPMFDGVFKMANTMLVAILHPNGEFYWFPNPKWGHLCKISKNAVALLGDYCYTKITEHQANQLVVLYRALWYYGNFEYCYMNVGEELKTNNLTKFKIPSKSGKTYHTLYTLVDLGILDPSPLDMHTFKKIL
jgi:hypothetical protein